MALALNQTIFRAYDIRGVVDSDLDEAIYSRLGQAVGTIFLGQGRRSMAVGRDARLSSPQFQQALIAGLRSTGMDVVDIGQVPTPLMYFAVEQLGLDAGAIVSASHNPPEYNGLKLRRAHPTFGSEPLASEDIQEVGAVALAGRFAEGAGALTQADVSDAYVASVARLLPFTGKRPRVVLDGGNGVGGPIGIRTYQALGLDVVPLFIEPDGRFPNHHPDPLKPENLQHLIAAVREHKADIGIGLDGDGDRLGVVDGEGQIVFADRYLIALATYLLGLRKGHVIFDVKCSAVLPKAIAALGGTPVMWKTGYSSISAKMRELDAVLGGELSGHTFATYPGHYFDDGTFAGAHLLFALAQLGTTLREALAPYPDLPSIDEGRIPFAEDQKFRVIDYVRDRFAGDYPVFDIDGVRVDFGDGWGLVRASNTEPAITTRFEAETMERAQAIRDLMMSAVEEFRNRL
ncbi:phosphomannomutase/phosphoglucomutase [Oscillochloris sp. ZM17-4]|uniref:phosphomannomutase/phosphoglucomutase n=1 Tax=Oscillochloris sp. ZM17-4 TaxID=2866714 RepID=UPI001C733518|nr:phosphomannomutase/phosphoglucomutase [Oscillochloris sp. ZM17-4]MBX0331199.1 phosphomannomutase/phosphoglucomutase [Oscillochloris sp. ZM17-4]